MKKIYMLGFALLAGTMSFAQQAKQTLSKKEYSPSEKITSFVKPVFMQDKNAVLWEDDCSDANTWLFTNENTGGIEVDWEISTDPAEIPVSVLSPFESETADNGFLFISSDANNTTDGDGTQIIVTAQNATPINLSGYDDVLLRFSYNYRWYEDTRTVRVSGDGGLTWTDYIFTIVDNPGGYYPEGSYAVDNQNSGNPEIVTIDVSDVAGGSDDVLVQFVYDDNDIWAWYWAVDDVKILERPANDIQVNYSVVTQNPADFIEYGRVPLDQIEEGISLSVNVFNFGAEEQTNVSVTASFTNGTTVINETASVATLAPNEYVDIDLPIQTTLTTGIYEGTFTVVSDQETDGDEFANNVNTRQFEITDGLYSQDGIGLYDPAVTSLIGPGSFLNADDDDNPYSTGALMTQYDIKDQSEATGVRIMIGGTDNVGSQIVSFMADTSDVNAGDLGNKLTESDLYTVTEADAAAGYVDLMFIEPVVLSGNTYYAGVQVEDGAGFRIIDDETVIQPAFASTIYLDQTYTNGEALGIQLFVSWIDGVNELVSTNFTLSQNTPNPANESTFITYELTNANQVSLNIVDITGKVVKTFNEGTQAAGIHNITVDVKDLSAGVYTYTLTVGTNQTTKKMIIE